MKRKARFALFVLILALSVPVRAGAAWAERPGGSYAWQDGQGKELPSRWFPAKKVGFVEKGGATYCYKESGKRYKGWLTAGGKRYYVDGSGKVLRSKWIICGTKRYYASKDGPIYKSCIVRIGDYKYGFKKNGVMVTGKAKLNNKTYYFRKENGRMVTNALVTIGSKTYYFGSGGALGKNVWVNGYYINGSGYASRDAWVGDRYVGQDGKRLTGLQEIGGYYYFFNKSTGKCVKNTAKAIDGIKYVFGKDGKGKASLPAKRTARPSVSVQGTYYTDPNVTDETLLSAIIYCEAGNQPYYGQLGVGIVITNRMRSPSFPSKLAEVVYQTTQFSPTFDGALSRALNNPSLVTQSCRKAAKEVLQMYKDNLYTVNVEGRDVSLKDYVFFMTQPAYVRLGLASAYIKLGDHVFFQRWCY